MFAGTTRSDAQVYFSIGFGPGYYGYPYACTIWYGGHRYHRHHYPYDYRR